MQLAFQCLSTKVRTTILVKIHMGPVEYFFIQYILPYLLKLKVGYIALHIIMLFLSNPVRETILNSVSFISHL